MDDLIYKLILFVTAISFSWLYFWRTNKADALNRDVLAEEVRTQKARIDGLTATYDYLKRTSLSRTESVEISDNLKLAKLEVANVKDLIRLAEEASFKSAMSLSDRIKKTEDWIFQTAQGLQDQINDNKALIFDQPPAIQRHYYYERPLPVSAPKKKTAGKSH